jgi:hypothetical protein
VKVYAARFCFHWGGQKNPENKQKDNLSQCILKPRNCSADKYPKDAMTILSEGIRIYRNVAEITQLLADVYLLSEDD